MYDLIIKYWDFLLLQSEGFILEYKVHSQNPIARDPITCMLLKWNNVLKASGEISDHKCEIFTLCSLQVEDKQEEVVSFFESTVRQQKSNDGTTATDSKDKK